MNRTCDGCAECCKGWLEGSALGHAFYPGKPCFYLQKTCSIYESRPADPCRSYKCFWLSGDELPMWMRPDMSNAIVTHKKHEDIEYFEIAECGKKLDSAVLSWLFIWAFNTGRNLKYQIDGGWNKVGNKNFIEARI